MTRSRPYMHAGFRCVVAALVGLLLAGPSLSADEGNQWTGWDPGTVVEINLERGRIIESLPFDVPFYLLAPPPDPLVPNLEPRAFLAVNPRSAPACDATRLPDNYCGPYPTDACLVPIRKVKEKVNNTGSLVEQVEISIPQLKPRRDYCLVVAIPREPTSAEAQLMHGIAEARLAIAANTASSREEVLTADWIHQVCEDIGAEIEDTFAERRLTVIPKDGSALENCQDAAIDALFGKVVSTVSLDSLETSLTQAVTTLEILKKAIPADEPDPRLREIRNLSSPADQFQYIGFPGTLPHLVSKEQLAAWSAAVAARRAELEAGWQNRASEIAICNDGDATLAAPALIRMRCFAISELDGVAFALTIVARDQNRLGDDVDNLLDALRTEIVRNVALGATTWAPFEQRFRWYVSADTGFAYAWDIEEAFAYTGANIYFSPVNKRAPLNGLGVRQPFSRRFALVIGLPTEKLEDPSRKPIVGDFPVIIGAGIRLTDQLRVTGGALVFEEVDPDPLIDDTRGLKVSPFVSLSLDVNVVGIFTGLFGQGPS